MVQCGYHAVCGSFNFYLDNDKICVDGKGGVDGTCYFEQWPWEHPGCEEHELDVDTLWIEGHVSTVENDFEDCQRLSLHGMEAWKFLTDNGLDENEIDWDVDDSYDEEYHNDYD